MRRPRINVAGLLALPHRTLVATDPCSRLFSSATKFVRPRPRYLVAELGSPPQSSGRGSLTGPSDLYLDKEMCFGLKFVEEDDLCRFTVVLTKLATAQCDRPSALPHRIVVATDSCGGLLSSATQVLKPLYLSVYSRWYHFAFGDAGCANRYCGDAPTTEGEIETVRKQEPTWKVGEDMATSSVSNKNGNDNENYSKSKSRGYQAGSSHNFTKEGFKVWNNSRFGALEDLYEEVEEETHNEEPLFERSDGPTGAILSRKGKRAQVQVLEAQIANDKLGQPKKANNSKGSTSYKDKGPSTVQRSKRSSKQLAEIKSHTMVRGFEKGKRVVRMTITKKGGMEEEVVPQ
nr:uncharacterized protein LOC109158743 [Ipomoea batatas]